MSRHTGTERLGPHSALTGNVQIVIARNAGISLSLHTCCIQSTVNCYRDNGYLCRGQRSNYSQQHSMVISILECCEYVY